MIYFFTALGLCSLLAACISIEKSRTIGGGLYAVSLLALLVPALIGMDFSPSFTAWFLAACMGLCIASELLSRSHAYFCKEKLTFLKYFSYPREYRDRNG